MKNLIFIIILTCTFSLQAQTFTNSTPTAIPASTSTCVPVTVSGVGAINSVYGLNQVCMNLTITNVYPVYISLKAPDGTEYYLSYKTTFTAGSNYATTCFNSSASTAIWSGTPPYNGNYKPETNLGAFNNGMDANGIWYLCIYNGTASAASLTSFSVNFASSPSNTCGAIATDNCADAPLICDFNGYCGTTSGYYTVGAGEGTSISGCGYALNNNSWVKFVPNATSVTINVTVDQCKNSDGVQFGVWKSTDCNTFTNVACAANPFIGTSDMTFSGLTIGDEYFLMIDGYAGDVCNYNFTVNGSSGVSVVAIDQGASVAACVGDNIALSVPNLPGVTYTWNWGANTASGSSITIPNANPPFNVNVTASGVCNNSSDQISITVSGSCCAAEAGEWDY